ncbi:MAG: TRAP transporter small permease subunit [Desulfovibrio sp.]|jgi:TRAP-type mannitol/chloroaromatic compound transport system permease small subunit|nr:TRAP transporter small permease subunit [Desulfovibrio sp.]
MSQDIASILKEQVPTPVRKAIAALDGLSVLVGKTAAWLAVPMMLSLIIEVVMRYLFRSPTIWALDMAVILYGIHFMLGSPYCLQAGQHIRTDFFYHGWSVRKKAVADLFNYVVLFFPVHVVFFNISCNYFYRSFSQNETSVTSPWAPIIWPAKLAIPVCVFLTLLQGFSEVLKCAYRFKTRVDLWPVSETGEAVD